MVVALGAALACGATVESPTDESASQADADDADQTAAARGVIIITTYYEEPELIHACGSCVRRTCPPKGRTCTGCQTPWFEVDPDNECF